MPSGDTFRKVLADAVRYFAQWGYENPDVLNTWILKLRLAAEREAGSLPEKQKKLAQSLSRIFGQMIRKGRLLERANPHVSKVTLQMIAPSLRSELDRRILASADLIRLNRTRAIEETLQRFSGWASSVPPGGSGSMSLRDVSSHIAKPLQSRTFEERRLAIDQGHKLVANVNHILALQSGAIAMKWRHVHQPGYDGRPEHIARDGQIFLLKDSWAKEKGLVRKGPNPYYDDIDQVSFLPFCRCWAEFKVSLSELPDEMLTKKGKALRDQTRVTLNAV